MVFYESISCDCARRHIEAGMQISPYPTVAGVNRAAARSRWPLLLLRALLRMLGVITLVAAASACHRTADEQQVREAITATQAAAEAGKAGDTVAALTDDFDGNGGEFDRRRLEGMVRLAALRGAHVGVTVGPVSVEKRGERLVATFTVTLTSSTGLIPDEGAIYHVETAWRREGSHWRCYSATWSR
jgi:hypothetical protein